MNNHLHRKKSISSITGTRVVSLQTFWSLWEMNSFWFWKRLKKRSLRAFLLRGPLSPNKVRPSPASPRHPIYCTTAIFSDWL